VRLWPLAVLVTLLVLALVAIWTVFGEQRQSRVLATIAATLCATILGVVWLVFFSRLPRVTRLGAALALLVLLVIAGTTIEVRGFSGDMLPILAFRWTRPDTGAMLQEHAGTSGAAQPSEADLDGDWPQFLGPRRDGTLPEAHLATDWSARPPRELWRRPVGQGWSGFAVAGPYAVTQEQRGAEELVTCYGRTTGTIVWVHRDAVRHDDSLGGPGPRATPTIHDGRVLALGGTGILNVLDLATGRLLWSVDVMQDNDVQPPVYGIAASPLVVGALVIVPAGSPPAGRSLVAYDVDSGRRVWAAGDDPAAYGSPVLMQLAGRQQIVWLAERHLVAQDPVDGAVLWREEWPAATEKVSQPVLLAGDRVFVSTGYGVGGKMFHVRDVGGRLEAELEWETTALKAKLSNVVLHAEHLYGLDDGILVALDASDGSRGFKGGRYGHGQLILAGGVLLIQSESGEVALVEAAPRAHRELGRLAALSDKTWNHPALAGRHLIVRNDREAACYELPLERRGDR
jgi:outer membrane protein assembly factor BamB